MNTHFSKWTRLFQVVSLRNYDVECANSTIQTPIKDGTSTLSLLLITGIQWRAEIMLLCTHCPKYQS